jgi:tetratricopeptide (TPR) repeat protein/ADP-heptose:LPS heptosyltransferase
LNSPVSTRVADRPDAVSPHQPADPYQSAVLHMQGGRNAEAQACCEQSLQQDPNNADALHLMGVLDFRSGRHDQAVEWFAHAIRISPQPNYLVRLAQALLKLERGEEAVRCFEKALQLKPDDADVWMNFGDALLQLQRNDLALQVFEQATQLDPGRPDISCQAGVLLYKAKEFTGALAHFDRCPQTADLLRQRACTLQALKRFDEALADNQKADAIEPGQGDTYNNIGYCLQELGRYEEALQWFERADAARPNTTDILNNKALLLGRLHRFNEAFALYDEMKVRGLSNAVTDWNRSSLEMLTGNFAAGWVSREARWSKPNPTPYPAFDRPMWLGGEPINGKTLLVYVDEGLGDTIQFARYVPMAADQGARVILVVERPAQRLLAGLPGVSECLIYPANPLPAFDLHCPVSSLPLAFGARLESIPAAKSYLPRADENRVSAWEKRLPRDERLRVGLVWSGNPTHPDDRNRSIPLSKIAGLLDIDACFVSLQKNPRPDDEAFLAARTDIVDLSADFGDLSDTAALIECLDLVITVDTSVAHLSAALGRPTWILIPHFPDYRWLLDREDSPWYPTVRLFRQTADRDYAPVICRVGEELAKLVRRQQPTPAPGH